ncbi:GGDEF domain-containing protein [Aquitalea aquatica]|uniref:Diguanylate cyclase n=1 Tax=Aquitalea aquatica TaxID=3044273 RepID=A0A838Y8U7_9NEIS|nr:PAS domain-containing protein [Aquitalea magnusonii]MBA4707214.1 diguanylate cyclase [Aquitalea magnusonii]
MASFPSFQSLIDTVQGALLLAQPASGRIISANQLAAILLATPHDELLGRDFGQYLQHPADAAELKALLASNSMVYNRRLQLKTATGRHFEVQLSLREVMLDDSTTLVISFSDRTESQMMSQLLNFEHQLVERSLNLVKSMKHEQQTNHDDDQLTGVVGMPQLLSGAHAETGRIRRYGGDLSGMAVQLINIPQLIPQQDNGSARRHLLRLAGSLCVQSTRDSDQVARQEDDVFLVLMPNTSLEGAHELGRRLLHSLGQLTYIHQGQEEKAQACIGISALRLEENSPNAMLDRLQGALSLARIAGANQIHRQA